MDEIDDLHDFWRQESPEGNFFTAVPPNPRSGTIATALLGRLDPSSTVLEVGCNVGRNVNHLFTMGYENIAGVEINEHAVERLRGEYPHLAGVTVFTGAAEDLLSTIPDNAYDIVFTMAVLEHIHPESASIYAEIARIAGQCVLAIEPRVEVGHVSHRQHPWDVPAEYAKHGLVPVATTGWSDLWSMPRTAPNYWHPAFDRYDATIFVPRDQAGERESVNSSQGVDILHRAKAKLRSKAGAARRAYRSRRG